MEYSGELVHVPEDITDEILRRLPAKSLVRFLCVCKSWRNLIKSAEFVESHRNAINRHPRAIVFKNITAGLEVEYEKEEKDSELTKMKLCNLTRDRLDGHSNGIICLTLKSRMDNWISIWNPALRQRRILPPSSGDVTNDYLYRLGFGYDSENRDYKVVSVPLENGSKPGEMYSLKSDSWKPIHCDHLQSLKYELFDISHSGCSFKGRLYWIVDCYHDSDSDNDSDNDNDNDHYNDRMFLVVFDLTGEKFLEFDIPESICKNDVPDYIYTGNLGVFKGCLSWLMPNSTGEYEIWSSEDDSCSPESWTIAWKFSPEALQLNNRLQVTFVELIGDESMMVYGDGFVYLYDFQMNGLKVRTTVPGHQYDVEHPCVPITNYVGTLVPVIRKRRRQNLPAIRTRRKRRRRKAFGF